MELSRSAKKHLEDKSMQKKQVLGCVADDFTGASDAASFLQKAGMSTLLLNEIQEKITIPEETDAVVIALKSRTQETGAAVKDTLQAVKWLEKRGASKFYFKYCSTFDSTKEGNIGPVADAVMEYFQQRYTVLCPSLPVNERIVKGGRLYVKGVALDESPMKNHPLTPMWDSRIKNLIESQSRYQAAELYRDRLEISPEECEKWLEEQGANQRHFYVVPDYADDKDGRNIVRLFGKLRFLTGGSGLLEFLAASMLQETRGAVRKQRTRNDRRGIVLAGSCSVATLGQIKDYQDRGGISYRMDPIALLEGRQRQEDILDFILQHSEEEVLIYSSDTAENVREVQKFGRARIADLIEHTLGGVASELVKHGYGRIVVAGGETSGAVTKALGFVVFEIGESVAPGVPIMTPVENKELRLVLKSGNFGQQDFFTRALKMTKGEEL